MKSTLKFGLAVAALLVLSAPVLAEATGSNHDPNVTIQHSNRTLTASISANCAPATEPAAAATGSALSASSMDSHAGSTGADLDMSAHGDKCAKGASGMSAPAAAATPAPAPAPAQH